MPVLICPDCGARAATAGSGVELVVPDGTFERRGKLRRSPVFKCRTCGATLVVRRRLLGGSVADVVDDETAAMMSVAWTDHVASAPIQRSAQLRRAQAEQRRADALAAGGVECPHCGKVLRSEGGLQAHVAAVHDDH